ncbi:DUF2064 domain-containing protein [archaeon]|nr:DUF2064 domain-containing protein [archaeon]
MSKYPEAGYSKTRLGESIGFENSADIAKAFLDDLILTYQDKYNIVVGGPAEDTEKFLENYPTLTYVGSKGSVHVQMRNAIKYAFSQNLNSNKVLAINADLPTLKQKNISDIFESLNDYGFVIQNTNRNKFGLIGMNKEYSKKYTWGLPFDTSEDWPKIIDMGISFLKRTLVKQKPYTKWIRDPLRDLDTLKDMKELYPDISKSDFPATFNLVKKYVSDN